MLDLIKKHEGLASKSKDKVVLCTQKDINDNILIYPYLCPANKLTIGWGVCIKQGEYQNGISVKQCEELLQSKANEFINLIDNLELDLNENQKEAVLSFCYNLGFYAFKSSTLLKEIKANNVEGIKNQWVKWCNIGKVPNKGLLKRRNEELELFFKNI